MRALTGVGTPRSLQGRAVAALTCLGQLLALIHAHVGCICRHDLSTTFPHHRYAPHDDGVTALAQ
ncbi:MAG: hypothetical protein M3Q85_13595, partial [Acidobacteriota bacterium]|nr:hypothetical protein [Acidobacteriota bacterium]